MIRIYSLFYVKWFRYYTDKICLGYKTQFVMQASPNGKCCPGSIQYIVEPDFTIYYFHTIQSSLTRTNIIIEHLRDYYSHASKTAMELFSLHNLLNCTQIGKKSTVYMIKKNILRVRVHYYFLYIR